MITEGMIDMTVDQIIEETISDKTTETKGIGIEAQVKIVIGQGEDLEIIQKTALGIGPTIETKVDTGTYHTIETREEVETDQSVEM